MSIEVIQQSIPEVKSLLNEWLINTKLGSLKSLTPIAGDASVRHYYRLVTDKKSYIVMDSTSDLSFFNFVELTARFSSDGVNVPQIHKVFSEHKVAVLQDFGDKQLGDVFSTQDINYFYSLAHKSLLDFNLIDTNKINLPVFCRVKLEEQLSLFSTWYLEKYLGVDTSFFNSCRSQLLDFFENELLSQPQVCVHMDYHSRNLMVTSENKIGVLDYQDAVVGPIGYDLISLWQDAYREFSQEQISQWATLYSELYNSNKPSSNAPLTNQKLTHFSRVCGLQRHLKNLGIFARLKFRYNKPGYTQYIPRLLGYIHKNSQDYPELAEFFNWLCNQPLPDGEIQ